ncbi:hypothetical protein E4U47_003285 [Claviceps purpurea]|nr:hypothetical protein E4U47_003285 [Claviceps purpurea]
MTGPIIRGIGEASAWVVITDESVSPSRIERIAKAGGASRRQDKKIGVRLDYGQISTKGGKNYQRLELQVNKDAHDPSLNDMAKKDSHKVWSCDKGSILGLN